MVLGTTVIHVLIYGPMFHVVSLFVGMFVTVPVLLAAWFFGARAGLAAGLATFPLNSVLGFAFTDSENADFIRRGGFMGSGAEMLVGYVVGLVRDLNAKAQEHASEMERTEQALMSLRRKLVEVQEEERRNIARDLHDEIGQVLTGRKLLLEARGETPSADDGNRRQAIDLLDDLMRKVRDLSLDLRPSMLDEMGLVPTLYWMVRRYSSQTGVDVELAHDTLDGRLGDSVETAAYRIVQEALTNVARHASTDSARVPLHQANGTLGIVVEDHVAGFDPEEVLSRSSLVGLAGIRERAQLLGGTLQVESGEGEGTRVRVALPTGESGPT